MKRFIYLLIAACTLSFITPDVYAGGGKKRGPKTVHVKSYKTKKGKTVHAYKRSKPRRR